MTFYEFVPYIIAMEVAVIYALWRYKGSLAATDGRHRAGGRSWKLAGWTRKGTHRGTAWALEDALHAVRVRLG